MANNSFTNIIKVIGPIIQDTLRKKGGLFRHVNGDFSTIAAQKGDTIDASFPVAISVTDVTPGPTGSQAPGVTPTKVSLTLNKWKHGQFYLTHKQAAEIEDNDFVRGQVAEAVEAMIGQVETDLFTEAVSGSDSLVTKYAANDLSDFTSSLRPLAEGLKVLADAKAPQVDRAFVMSPAAALNFRSNTSLLKVNEAGDGALLREGELGRILGVDLFESQHVPTYASGSMMGSANLLVSGSTDANMLVQKQGIGIAMRPGNSSATSVTITDPISGAPFTLTLFDQEYQQKWTVSALYGVKTIRGGFSSIIGS